MIADLSKNNFGNEVLNRKIDYSQKKIDLGCADFLYASLGSSSLLEFKETSNLIVNLNDRVVVPYHEVVISLNENEIVSNEKFIDIAKEYMDKLGAGDTSYSIVKHNDTDNSHIHILFTTIDIDGKRINNYNERIRSQKISRDLEIKYSLQITEYNKFNKNSLAEIKAREFYFHKALVKGLKSFGTKNILNEILVHSPFNDIKTNKALTNSEYELLLGREIFDRVGEVLEQNSLFVHLYKDELILKLDAAYLDSKNVNEFKIKLIDQGCYMRLITDKGHSKYVYGLSKSSMYFNDNVLPIKYRYGNLNLKRETLLAADEQKHYIYNQSFIALNESVNYSDFKTKMLDHNINVIESINKGGIYGISFSINNVDNSVIFKSSDISRRLGYKSILNHMESLIPKVGMDNIDKEDRTVDRDENEVLLVTEDVELDSEDLVKDEIILNNDIDSKELGDIVEANLLEDTSKSVVDISVVTNNEDKIDTVIRNSKTIKEMRQDLRDNYPELSNSTSTSKEIEDLMDLSKKRKKKRKGREL